MPYRRKKKVYKKKKRGYRYPLVRKSPMPKRFLTKLRYAENGLSVNPGAGLVAEYIFRANDVYDPNQSGVGHQPRGFDQLMPLYNHFTVLGSRITIRASNQDNNDSVNCFLTLQGEATTQTNPIDLMERQDVRSLILGPKGAGPANGTLSYNFSAKRFFGPSQPMNDTTQRGSAAASPTEQAYYHFGCVALDGLTDVLAIPFSVVIDYIVMFHEPNDVASS